MLSHLPSDAAKESAANSLEDASPLEPPMDQIMLIGAAAWVKTMIARLHNAQIAEVGNWSRLMPTGKPDEVISMQQRPRGSR